MEDWQDEDRILDQLLVILKPEHRAELERATQAARAVPLFPLAQMAGNTEQTYGDLAQHVTRQTRMSNLRLYQAVKTVSGNEKEAASRARRAWWDKPLLELAHIALRLRYTLLGAAVPSGTGALAAGYEAPPFGVIPILGSLYKSKILSEARRERNFSAPHMFYM